MDKYDSVVNNLKIATPCSVPWESMEGDDRTRFCGMCKLNVYNVAEMSGKEVQELISKKQGERVCMQLYRRKDGTVITRDCPLALHRVKKATKRWVAAVIGFATTTGLSLPGWAQQPPVTKCGTLNAKLQTHATRGAVRVNTAEPPETPEVGDLQVTTQVEPVPEQQPILENKENGPPCSKFRHDIDFSSLVPWGISAVIFASLLVLLRRRSSMWIIGFTMVGLFAALGYAWCTHL